MSLYFLFVFVILTIKVVNSKTATFELYFTSPAIDLYHDLDEQLNGCPVTNCKFLEFNENKTNYNKSCLIVHLRNENPSKYLNYKNYTNCIIGYNFESDLHCKNCHNPKVKDGFVNFEYSHKQSSDFPMYDYHSHVVIKENKTFNTEKNFMKNKTKLAAALISNIHYSPSERIKIIEKLRDLGLEIDIYGSSGLQCPYNCKEYIADNYLFYLAFENSLCPDYISEKYFGFLNKDIIIVTYGLGNYTKYTQTSHIDVLEYNNLTDLAKRLIYLSKNRVVYNSLFLDRKQLSFEQSDNYFECNICKQMNDPSFFKRLKKKSLTFDYKQCVAPEFNGTRVIYKFNNNLKMTI